MFSYWFESSCSWKVIMKFLEVCNLVISKQKFYNNKMIFFFVLESRKCWFKVAGSFKRNAQSFQNTTFVIWFSSGFSDILKEIKGCFFEIKYLENSGHCSTNCDCGYYFLRHLEKEIRQVRLYSEDYAETGIMCFL